MGNLLLLPPKTRNGPVNLETIKGLKALAVAHRNMAVLMNEQTGELLYRPPETEQEIREFYTRIGNVEKTLGVTRKTASGYLMQLAEAGFLDVEMRGREKLYINRRLIELIQK